ARAVAEAVVDVLEVVEVEQEHRAAVPVARSAGHPGRDLLREASPVEQPGQGVVVGQLAQARLAALALGDVAEAPDAAVDGAVAAALRLRVALEHAPVLEPDDVVALGLGVLVELADL